MKTSKGDLVVWTHVSILLSGQFLFS